MTGHHVETVRRYLLGATPSTEFLSKLCDELSLSADWVLTGSGAMRQADSRAETLRSSSPTDLLAAVAGAMERMGDRIDRIETAVRSAESRQRAASKRAKPERGPAADGAATPTDPTNIGAHDADTSSQSGNPAPGEVEPGGEAKPLQPVVKQMWVTGVVPKKARSDGA